MKVGPIFICLLFLLTHSVSGKEFYVSPKGDDSNAGTEEKPFRTLTKARDAVRKVNGNMTESIFVYLGDGRYQIEETIQFSAEDSGTNGYKVVYAGKPDEDPVLTGGRIVTGWQAWDKRKHIYKAKVGKNLFRQLYINDSGLAIRARTPNCASFDDLGPRWPATVREKPKVLIKKEHWNALAKVPERKLAQVEMVMVCHWYHQRIRIGEANDLGKEVEISPVNPKGKFNKILRFYQNNKGLKNPFYFENALAFVDAEYEWFHDPEEGYLYLAFPADKKPEELTVEIPVVETLIDIKGTPDKPVSDIEFRGLTLQCSNWTAPSLNGVNMTQGTQVVGGSQPTGLIEARHTKSLALRKNSIRNAGGHGILLVDADDTDIEGNPIGHIAANGIDIDRGSGRNPPPEKQSINVAIWNSHAIACGSHYSNGAFLLTANVRGLIVEHNLIEHMPYSGMQIGQQPGKMQDVGCGDNRIRFNYIRHCTQIHGDGGGIYTLGGIQRGTIIASNYISDIPQSKWDHYKVDHIYLDNFSSKIVVQNNVVVGGRVAERNGSAGSFLLNNIGGFPADIKGIPGFEVNKDTKQIHLGMKQGYNPRHADGEKSIRATWQDITGDGKDEVLLWRYRNIGKGEVRSLEVYLMDKPPKKIFEGTYVDILGHVYGSGTSPKNVSGAYEFSKRKDGIPQITWKPEPSGSSRPKQTEWYWDGKDQVFKPAADASDKN